MKARWLAIGMAVLLMLEWGAVAPGRAQERVTDEDLEKRFGKSHAVMKTQYQLIHQILDGFLLGDSELIQRNTNELAQTMREVGYTFPPEPRQEVEVWNAMSKIVQQARLLQERVAQGSYQEAYKHFLLMIYQCLKCHQTRRTWGQFPVPEPEKSKE